MLRGRAALEAARTLKAKGFDPKLIIGHPGWGETLFLRDVFPRARVILHGEFYYHAQGFDVGFDPEFPGPDTDERVRILAKNATLAMAYVEADAIVTPTPFQASALPISLSSRVHVIHEGVDLQAIRRPTPGDLRLPDGRRLTSDTPLVTYVSRNMEPLRGFHIFMRALPEFLDRTPDAHAILIGASGRGYGMDPGKESWPNQLLAEVGSRLDLSRVHFVGRVPHGWMLDAICLASAHVYYTYPFVLSWSLLEAMATGAVVLASDTAPVRDVIVDNVSGLLNPFFDVEALSAAMTSSCANPEAYAHLRSGARAAVAARYDRRACCLPRWLALVDEVLRLGPA